MERASIVVTADDYGLTRRVNETILEAADRGALTRVSVLANGYAVDGALREWRPRAQRLSLSVHFNLTEGKPLSPRDEVPHLVDARGNFRHSSFSLLARTLCAGPRLRRALAREIRLELAAQAARVRAGAPGAALFADGHQHAHMVPLVFAAVLALHRRDAFAGVRICHEPLFWSGSIGAYAGIGIARHAALNLLSAVCRRRADAAGLAHPDAFIGTLMSGRLTEPGVRRALAAAGGGTIEIAAHPGEALPGELASWKGDVPWYSLPWRERERGMLCSASFAALVAAPPAQDADRYRIARFFVVGSASFAIHIGLLYAFVSFLGWWYVPATTVAWGMAFVFSFTLQKVWTFDRAERPGTARQMRQYFLLQCANAALNALSLYALVSYAHVWYLSAQAAIALALACSTYVISHYGIFARRA